MERAAAQEKGGRRQDSGFRIDKKEKGVKRFLKGLKLLNFYFLSDKNA